MTRRRSSIFVLVAVAVVAVVVAATEQQRAPSAPRATPTPTVGFVFAGPPPIDPVPWAGVRWNAVDSGLDLPPGMHVAGITALPGAIFAFGQGPIPRGVPPPLDGLTSTGTVWLSTDALTWHARPIVAGVPNGRVTEVRMLAAGPKGIVALGTVCCGGDESLAAWWSADGLSWQRAAFPNAREGGPVSVAAGPAGFAAVGMVGGDDAIWTSAEGLDWQRLPAAAAELGVGSVDHVVATSEGLVAVGHIDAVRQHSDAAIWVSQGLDAWHRVAAGDATLTGPDEASLSRIIPFAGGLFAAGGTGTHDDRVACEQLIGGGAVAGPGDIALSCGWLRDMNWRAHDVAAWQRVDPWGDDGTYPPDFVGGPPGRAPESLQAVHAGGPGLIALPYELIEDHLNDSGSTIGVWTSSDAKEWERVAAGPDLGAESPAGWAVVGRQIIVMTDKGDVFVGTALP